MASLNISAVEQQDAVDPLAFRSAMSAVCTPVTVVTAFEAGRPHGTTVSAFASLSMNPAMVVVALDHTSDLLTIIRSSQRFGVNVLAQSQAALALAFAVKGTDKFAGVAWSSVAGLPRIAATTCWFACTAENIIDGGDHVLVTGMVTDIAEHASAPLTYHRRMFGTHSGGTT